MERTSLRVAVTGANGFVGSHVVARLMARGHQVRAVVRDARDASRCAHLPEGIELVSGDLMSPGGYDEAFRDAEVVCHLAASTRLSARDPQREIVDVAVTGTRHALEAARRAGARRVVLCSSMAAVLDPRRPEDHAYSEADWNDGATLATPYPLAKTAAERAAWDWRAALPEAERPELVVLNPAMVLGPVSARSHLRSSPATIRDLLRRAFPACPRFHLGIVDARDVAEAHAAAVERPGLGGREGDGPVERILLHGRGLWLEEIAHLIAPHFRDHRVPTRQLPDLLVYGSALFDKRLSFEFLKQNLGRRYIVDNQRSISRLGVIYRPVDETLLDTARSMVEQGWA